MGASTMTSRVCCRSPVSSSPSLPAAIEAGRGPPRMMNSTISLGGLPRAQRDSRYRSRPPNRRWRHRRRGRNLRDFDGSATSPTPGSVALSKGMMRFRLLPPELLPARTHGRAKPMAERSQPGYVWRASNGAGVTGRRHVLVQADSVHESRPVTELDDLKIGQHDRHLLGEHGELDLARLARPVGVVMRAPVAPL